MPRKKEIDLELDVEEQEVRIEEEPKAKTTRTTKSKIVPADKREILTANVDDEIVTELETKETVIHELTNAFRTRNILTGIVNGVELLESKSVLAIIDYKGIRVLIPATEFISNASEDLLNDNVRMEKLVSNMLGSEIDFFIKGIDTKELSVVASRKEAMQRKATQFYTGTNPKIINGQVVQARIVAINERAVRLEVFGVETTVSARDLSTLWVTDVRENYFVGSKVLVIVNGIEVEENDNIKLIAKSAEVNKNDIDICKVNARYTGEVVGVKNGTIFIALSIGANAIAHKQIDRRTILKGDTVSFVCTRLDKNNNVAIGIISKIIKRRTL